MTPIELEKLSAKQLNRLKKHNAFSFHAFMMVSVIFLAKAFLYLNPLVLILAIGFIITAHTFYSNIRTINSLRQVRSNS